ncbi:MAG: hypothetical protein QOF44_5322 [Streptomyces sp.]|nr:hypothetical protein [Streptomyces sp.]
MSKSGLAGMQLATNDILEVARTLTGAQWTAPSAAQGWSVKDVVAHAGNLLGVVIDAVNGQLMTPDGMGIEELNDVQVARQRDRSPNETMDFLEKQLAQALPLFTALQEEPLASNEAALLDLGSYPLHTIVDMFTFDFTTHLHLDILAPRGPINRTTQPLDEAHLGPSVSWLLGGIPKMQPDLWRRLAGPLALELTGPAARSVVLNPTGSAITLTPAQDHHEQVLATVRSTTADMLAWSTTRVPWRDLVTVDGDQTVAATFLDALNLT